MTDERKASDASRLQDTAELVRARLERADAPGSRSTDRNDTGELSDGARIRREVLDRWGDLPRTDRDIVSDRLERIERAEKAAAEQGLDAAGQKMVIEGTERQVLARFGELLPVEKRKASVAESTRFEAGPEFTRHLEEKLRLARPDLSDEEVERRAEGVVGYTERSGDIFVNNDRPELYGTLMHEQIHRFSSDELRRQLGTGMTEGLTEHFTRRLAGPELRRVEPVFDQTTHRLVRLEDRTFRAYTEEVEIVETLGARVGDGPLERALFSGDVEPLREALEVDLGQGSFADFRREMLEADSYESDDQRRAALARAKRILKGRG